MGVTMSDLILRGGTVVDGTGQPGRAADVLIQDGVIAEIGSLRGRRADREIDAEGHVVTPQSIRREIGLDCNIEEFFTQFT